MNVMKKAALILAAGLMAVALTAAGVQALGGTKPSQRTNYRGPARNQTTATTTHRSYGSNAPAQNRLKSSKAVSPARTNNPTIHQGGSSK